MARLWSCGFELQSATTGVEFTTSGLGGSDGIDTAVFRTGLASLKLNPAAGFSWINQIFKAASSASEAIIRVYIRFAALPGSGTCELFTFSDSGLVNQAAYIRYNATGTKLEAVDNAGAVIGSSAAVTTGVWYRIELDAAAGAGTGTVKAYLNGTNFASSTTATVVNFDSVYIGVAFTSSTITMNIDDIAINDTSGGSQNSLPGAGQIVHLQPNAAGDNNSFTVAVGGTAGQANNFTRVKEVTPDDATSYNGGVLNTDIDDFKMIATPSSIATGDTINVVQVGVRFNAAVAAAEASFKVRCKKTSGGTVASSAAITPNSTTFRTNAIANPINYPLTLYQDPDSINWIKANLDTSQIGYNISTTNTNAADISTVWMLIDSTPSTTKSHLLSSTGVGS